MGQLRPKPVKFVADATYDPTKGPAPQPLNVSNIQSFILPASITTAQLGQALINLGLMKAS